jgi:hypothetical protein
VHARYVSYRSLLGLISLETVGSVLRLGVFVSVSKGICILGISVT